MRERMTREIIEDFRFIVIPYMVNRFKEINYEGQGGSDAKEFMSNFNEICDLAIKALEQEPTTKNNLGVDAISRDEVCRYVAEFVNHEFSTREEEELIDNIITGIEHMPSVTPQEPKTGHWKLVQRSKFIDVCCSNCEAVRIKDYAYNYTIDQFNKEDLKECFECADMRYCPNCGAKMVQPQESEDKE